MNNSYKTIAVRVAFLGIPTLDKIWLVQNMPTNGLKTKATHYMEVGGGMAANAAVACSQLGAKTYFFARAGNDNIGQTIKYQLEQYNINCEYFHLIDDANSSVSAVIVSADGERTIVNCPGTIHSSTPAWLPMNIVQGMDAVQSDTRCLTSAVALFKFAKNAHIPTILDGEKSSLVDYNKILPFTDYAIFSQTGINNLIQEIKENKTNYNCFNNNNYTEILQNLSKIYSCKVIAVTMGVDGVIWIENSTIYHQKSYKVKVVDTTGAGDVFHGAFSFAIANKYSTTKAMQLASAVAAIKCTHLGGRSSSDLQQIEDFLNKQ